MKYILQFSFILTLLLETQLLYSQQSKISTDPKNPINTERPELKNTFNWEDRNFNVFHPDGHFTDGNNNSILVGNPFYKREPYQEYFNLYNFETNISEEQENLELDFHPKDGWELLYKNNGIDPFGVKITDPLKNRIGPYFVLYNRYTGLIRILAAFDGLGTSDKIQTTLKLKQIAGLDVSGLFNFYGSTAQPLDRKTSVTEIAQVSAFASNRGFISADFQMSYDPCNCTKKSELTTSFSLLNTADIKMSGRLIGTIIPLDGSGNSPLLSRKDFLTTVYKDGFDVMGGALTYSNIDKLVAKYKDPYSDPIEKAAIDIFKTALVKGGGAIDDKLIGSGVAIVFNELFSGIPFYKDQKSVGLGIVASGAKALSAGLFPDHKIPNISFIEAELALSGTMTDNNPLNNGSNTITVPGSLNSSSSPWQYYPLYNKPLGLFALLETPKIVWSERCFSKGSTETGTNGITKRTHEDYKFIKYKFAGNFKYTFNQNADININKTKIYGAIVITGKNPNNIEWNSNLQKVKERSTSTNEEMVYITPFVPIEYLVNVIPEKLYYYFHQTTVNGNTSGPDIKEICQVDVKLRIMIEYEFNKNSYEKVNKTLQIYTYPVDLVAGEEAKTSFQDLKSIQSDFTTTKDMINPQPYQTTVFAWDKIEIAHTVGADQYPNGSILFKANQIILKPGAIIKGGTIIKVGLPFEDKKPILPTTGSDLNDYCNTSYMGYLSIIPPQKSPSATRQGTSDSSSASDQERDTNPDIINNSDGIIIYPNPNNGSFTIENCNNFSYILVSNINGGLIYKRLISEKENSVQIILDNISSGIIFVKLIGKDKVVVKKIIVTK